VKELLDRAENTDLEEDRLYGEKKTGKVPYCKKLGEGHMRDVHAFMLYLT